MPEKDAWDLAGRDVVPDLGAVGRPADPGAAVLYALLNADGVSWSPPYNDFRSVLGVRAKVIDPEREEQSDERLRTWLVFFRSLGLVHTEQSAISVTDLGKELLDLMEQQYQATADFGRELSRSQRWRLARLVAPALARYQLRNPFNEASYAVDTDVHPIWVIWKAMRELDNKLHWDELDRALTPCLRMDQVDAAIERIRDARSVDGYDASDEAGLEAKLGPRKPVVSSQQDRVITWFSRAGFKGLLLEQRNRSDGFRYLQTEFLPLIDELLVSPPEQFAGTGATQYTEWLGQSNAVDADAQTISATVVESVVDRCRRYGHRELVTLVGPAGTGKTTAAREAALVLTEGEHGRVKVVQFHAAFTYEDFIGGLAPTTTGGFEPSPGAVIKINETARENPSDVYVLIIDELSRADTANVLGEFLTYVEYRDEPFFVPSLGREVRLADKLVVMATMNPSDRSVVNMDDALVRRLRFIRIDPDESALRSILDSAGMAAGLRDQVIGWFRGLPSDVPFGHGLFVGVRDEADLHSLWHEKLVYFMRRGGLTTYRDPGAIEDGFIWRRDQFRIDQPAALDPEDGAASADDSESED